MKKRKEREIIHENFHKQTTTQKKIIKRNNFTYRKIIEVIEKNISFPQKILDIGCGAGTLDFYLAEKGNNITGIDISKKAITICKKTAMELNIKNVQFYAINFPEKIPSETKYDLIIISEVIEHLIDDRLALKKIYNLLKKNGLVLISTPSKEAPLYKIGMLEEFDKKVGHLRRYSSEDLKQLCHENKLQIIYYEKTEGIIRNFLFTNGIAGKLVRYIKFFISDWITWADNVTIKWFGESNHYILAQKI